MLARNAEEPHTTSCTDTLANGAGKKFRAGVDVANCGQCSRCSSLADVDAMHGRATSLTRRALIAP